MPQLNTKPKTLTILITILLFAFSGCAKKQKEMSQFEKDSAPPAVSETEAVPKPKLTVVDIPDVAKMIVARRTGVETGPHEEYEILIRDSDGRNEQILAKRFFCRFSDADLVWYKEENAIIYVGKPNIDSTEGVWIYDCKNNMEKQLVKAEIGMGALQIAKDRKHLFYVTGGDWFSYNFNTGTKKLIYSFASRGGATINPEGTLVGGITRKSIFIEDVKTKKRYEWTFGNDSIELSYTIFSKSLKYVYYEGFHIKNGTFTSYFSPIILGKELLKKPVTNKAGCNGMGYFYLSNSGRFLYANCGEMHRFDTETNVISELPYFGSNNYFHLLEDQ